MKCYLSNNEYPWFVPDFNEQVFSLSHLEYRWLQAFHMEQFLSWDVFYFYLQESSGGFCQSIIGMITYLLFLNPSLWCINLYVPIYIYWTILTSLRWSQLHHDKFLFLCSWIWFSIFIAKFVHPCSLVVQHYQVILWSLYVGFHLFHSQWNLVLQKFYFWRNHAVSIFF